MINENHIEKANLIMSLRSMGISSSNVLSAIEQIPRELFIPKNLLHYAYENSQSTNSNVNSNSEADAYSFLENAKSSNPNSSSKRQYDRANNIDYRDGEGQTPLGADYSGWGVYDYGRTTLINNYTRVYKGGSWQDDAYWLSPGTKRHLNEDLAIILNNIGICSIL